MPAFLLAHLDYQLDAPAADRLQIYRTCLDGAHDHKFPGQIMLRLYHDVTRIPARPSATSWTPPA